MSCVLAVYTPAGPGSWCISPTVCPVTRRSAVPVATPCQLSAAVCEQILPDLPARSLYAPGDDPDLVTPGFSDLPALRQSSRLLGSQSYLSMPNDPIQNKNHLDPDLSHPPGLVLQVKILNGSAEW